MVFDFDKQLSVGNEGETHFRQYYADLHPIKSDDTRFDFVIDKNRSVELKTDTYDMEATPNFFMEMFGDAVKGKMGGPWRALQDNVDFFVYYFPKNRTFFWFEPITLCSLLDDIIAQGQLEPKEIKNKTWSAIGYIVPREALQSVLIRKDVF